MFYLKSVSPHAQVFSPWNWSEISSTQLTQKYTWKILLCVDVKEIPMFSHTPQNYSTSLTMASRLPPSWLLRALPLASKCIASGKACVSGTSTYAPILLSFPAWKVSMCWPQLARTGFSRWVHPRTWNPSQCFSAQSAIFDSGARQWVTQDTQMCIYLFSSSLLDLSFFNSLRLALMMMMMTMMISCFVELLFKWKSHGHLIMRLCSIHMFQLWHFVHLFLTDWSHFFGRFGFPAGTCLERGFFSLIETFSWIV